MNRAFSSVSSPAYSIHRPRNPNGVGLVICPGGGYRDVWIDREGHDLALCLKDHNVTSLVLKYRKCPADLKPANAWQDCLDAPGHYSASPVVANDHLYLASNRGLVSVVKAGDAFQMVHQHDLGEPVFATPAIDASTIYIRTETNLLAFRTRD